MKTVLTDFKYFNAKVCETKWFSKQYFPQSYDKMCKKLCAIQHFLHFSKYIFTDVCVVGKMVFN